MVQQMALTIVCTQLGASLPGMSGGSKMSKVPTTVCVIHKLEEF